MSNPNFFSSGSPFLNHPLLTPERTLKEVDFVLEHANLEDEQRVLDVGCGFGRHSIELARRGYDVVGIDPSGAMIVAADERAAEVWGKPVFIQARGEEFTSEDKFNAAICLFTSLGQIDEHGENSGLVKRVAEVLISEGVFIVEVPNHHWVAENLQTSDRFGDDDSYTVINRQYDDEEKIVTEKFELISPLEKKEYHLRYRLFSQKDLGKLLNEANFIIKAILGDYDGNPYTYYTPSIIIVAQKR